MDGEHGKSSFKLELELKHKLPIELTKHRQLPHHLLRGHPIYAVLFDSAAIPHVATPLIRTRRHPRRPGRCGKVRIRDFPHPVVVGIARIGNDGYWGGAGLGSRQKEDLAEIEIRFGEFPAEREEKEILFPPPLRPNVTDDDEGGGGTETKQKQPRAATAAIR